MRFALCCPNLPPPDPDFASLQALGFIDHPDGATYADRLFSANFPNDYRVFDQLHTRSYINQIGQIPAPVAAGIGYTILPRSGINAFAARDQLQIIALKSPVQHDLWLLHQKARPLPARERSLQQLLATLL